MHLLSLINISGRPPSRQSSYESEEEEPDPNKPYNEMVYVGKKIPSKAFLRLKKSVSRPSKKQSVGKEEFVCNITASFNVI